MTATVSFAETLVIAGIVLIVVPLLLKASRYRWSNGPRLGTTATVVISVTWWVIVSAGLVPALLGHIP